MKTYWALFSALVLALSLLVVFPLAVQGQAQEAQAPAADNMIAPPPSPAPPTSPEGPGMQGPLAGMDEKDTRQLVETLRAVRMAQELGLNDEQTVLLMRRMKTSRDNIEKQVQEHRTKAKALHDAIDANASEADIQAKLDELMALDKKVEDARQKAFEETAATLNVTQKAKLYLFQQEFDRNLREMVGRARERRMERWNQDGDGPQPPAGIGQRGQRDERPGQMGGRMRGQGGQGPQGGWAGRDTQGPPPQRGQGMMPPQGTPPQGAPQQ